MNEELTNLDGEIKEAQKKLLELKSRALELEKKNSRIQSDLTADSSLKELENYKSKLHEIDKRIQKTEKFFNVGKWSIDFVSNAICWSAETYKIFDYPDDYKGSLADFYISCADEYTKDRIPEYRKLLRTSFADTEINQSIVTPLGTRKLLSFSSTPILNEKGEIIGAKGLVKDLSDTIIGGQALDNFFNLSQDLHCIAHPDQYFVKLSPAWTNLLGYTNRELLSRSYMEFIHPEDVDNTVVEADNLDSKGSVYQFENRYIAKTGEVVYLEWNCQVDPESKLTFCSAKDITQTKFEKEALLNDISAKELLLREIHHRVKNNLQIISSLLSLQAGANHDEDRLLKLYEDSKNRIRSMAAIHEMFYQSEELDKIEFGKYLQKLVGDLAVSFNSVDKTINFAIVADPVYVNLDTAIPLGLVINEVVTNSMKHGLDKDGNVRITINMKSLEGNYLEIVIGDNGVDSVGDILDQDFDTLGVLLINSLVDQIDGEIEQLADCDGTVFKLTFENKLEYKM